MSYSSIYNVDASLNYEVRLNGETFRKNVKPHHVASVIYELESQGESVVDETWDDENMVVDLISTEDVDSEESHVDEQNEDISSEEE